MQEEAYTLGIRKCRFCLLEKPAVASKAYKCGYDTICLECSRQKVREWRQTNKDKHNTLNREYQKRQKGVINAKTAKYQASKKQRVPLWANLEQIKKIYSECPKGYHVDHIVPLQGELVSGLHVEYNLQYLPAIENKSKSNKWQM